MSGAFDATFQAPIPGSSLAYRYGDHPHTRPPKYVNPNDALEYFWKQLSQPQIMQQIWQIARKGGTVWAMTKAILFKAAFAGIIQMNLGIVIYPTVAKMIEVIIRSRGIEPKINPKFKNPLRDQAIKDKMKELMKQYGGQQAPTVFNQMQMLIQQAAAKNDQNQAGNAQSQPPDSSNSPNGQGQTPDNSQEQEQPQQDQGQDQNASPQQSQGGLLGMAGGNQ